ncbi:hypothetical protein DYB32_009859, partial [Aphanomyces invadans]
GFCEWQIRNMRQLDSVIELGGFMEDMKLKVDHEVKLRLTFDTAVGTLMLTNLKCWVAAAPLQVGLGDLIVSRDEMARLGYCPNSLLASARRAQSVYDLDLLRGEETPLMAAMKVVETFVSGFRDLGVRRSQEAFTLMRSERVSQI